MLALNSCQTLICDIVGHCFNNKLKLTKIIGPIFLKTSFGSRSFI